MAPKATDHWETFNRRFDTLCAEHCRDADGRLIHIRRGHMARTQSAPTSITLIFELEICLWTWLS